MYKNILLTGSPGSGKTTLIQQCIEQLDRPASGFYTREIREKGKRVGFELVTLDGEKDILAHQDLESPQKVSKYGVNVAVLDELAVQAIRKGIEHGILVVIDEIGPMEILSKAFRETVLKALNADAPVLGTIARHNLPFLNKVRQLPDVTVIELRRDQFSILLNSLVDELQSNN